MIKSFPVTGVKLREVICVSEVKKPYYSGENFQAGQNEYALQVEGVAGFFVSSGNKIQIAPVPGADQEWVALYLNGQVLVALLHQRKTISFHASSFVYDGRGVMILGETGAGKSSLTASFVLSGAGFLTDDLTPVIFRAGKPYMWPLYKEVKIRKNTAEQLKIGHDKLRDAEAGTGKQYLNLDAAEVDDYPLHTVLKIEVGDVIAPEFDEPLPAEKFSLLRSEVCSWENLAGMPETETAYLQQLVQTVEKVRFVRVVRPAEIRIVDFHAAVSDFLDRM